MKHLLLFALLLPGAVFAQTIEFEPPSQIVVAEGLLSVTFGAEAGEAQARAFVEGLGYGIREIEFSPLRAQLTSLRDLTPQERARLEALPGAREVHVLEAPAPVFNVPSTLETPPFTVTMVFEPGTAEASVRQALEAYDALTIRSLVPSRGRIVVQVEGEEEQAVRRLERGPLVRYVTYVSAN